MTVIVTTRARSAAAAIGSGREDALECAMRASGAALTRLALVATTRQRTRARLRAPASALAVALLASACAPMTVTPAPRGVQRIAVLPIDDVYGQGLPIRYATIVGLVEGQAAPITVPELLERDLRGRLRAQGFEVTDAATVRAATGGRAPRSEAEAARMAREASLPGAALYGVLSRWDASRGVSPDYITVALDLVLLDPATGAELWRARWPTRPVPTAGAGSYAVAAEMASAWVVERLTADLRSSEAMR